LIKKFEFEKFQNAAFVYFGRNGHEVNAKGTDLKKELKLKLKDLGFENFSHLDELRETST
jgi:hypothetical protein